MKKERSSGLELLRIIGIILIIAYHYVIFGGYKEFTAGNLSGGVVFLQMVGMFGKMACSFFAMISGFFLIGRKGTNYSKALLIVMDVLFFTVLIAFVAWRAGEQITVGALVRSGLNWYIVYYLIFLFFVPYINILMNTISRAEATKLMVLMFVFWSVIPTLTYRQVDFGELDFFIVMYMAGAYVRLHIYGKVHYPNRRNLLAGLGMAMLMGLSVVAFDTWGGVLGNDFLVQNACYFRPFNMVFPAVCAVSLFMYFSNLKISSKVINFVAGSVLQILIIHMNKFFLKWIWQGIYPNADYVDWPYLHATVKIAGVFMGCFLISSVYRLTVRRYAEKIVADAVGMISKVEQGKLSAYIGKYHQGNGEYQKTKEG